MYTVYSGLSTNQPIQLRKPGGLLKFEFSGLESRDKDPNSEPRGGFARAPRSPAE